VGSANATAVVCRPPNSVVDLYIASERKNTLKSYAFYCGERKTMHFSGTKYFLFLNDPVLFCEYDSKITY